VVFDSGYAFYIYLQFVWSGACPNCSLRFRFSKRNNSLYFLYDGFGAQTVVYEIFAFSILLYGSLILIMALLKGIFLFFVRQTLIVMSRHIEYDLKNEIYHHYQTLPLSFYRKNNTGDLMARISEDVGKVRMYVEFDVWTQPYFGICFGGWIYAFSKCQVDLVCIIACAVLIRKYLFC
jgi:ABC-type multidrug transport system fused ATPase/permease subunit